MLLFFGIIMPSWKQRGVRYDTATAAGQRLTGNFSFNLMIMDENQFYDCSLIAAYKSRCWNVMYLFIMIDAIAY